MNNLNISCEAYEHFKLCLDELRNYEYNRNNEDENEKDYLESVKFNIDKINLNQIENYMDYERSKYLVIIYLLIY